MSIQIKEEYILEINYDEAPLSPREDDNLGKLFFYSNKFNHLNELTIEEFQLANIETHYIISIYSYNHGEIDLSTTPYNDKFDSSHVGWILCSKDNREVKLLTEEKVLKILQSEIKTFSNYLSGDIYCFKVKLKSSIEYKNKTFINIEDFDSCYGFYHWEDIKSYLPNDILYNKIDGNAVHIIPLDDLEKLKLTNSSNKEKENATA